MWLSGYVSPGSIPSTKNKDSRGLIPEVLKAAASLPGASVTTSIQYCCPDWTRRAVSWNG